MVRFFGRVKANAGSVIVLAKINWCWVRFGPRVRKVQICSNLAHDKPAVIDVIVNEVDRNGNVFYSCCDSLSFQYIDACLAIFVDWSR